MDGRPTWTDCDKAGDYVVPNVLSPRDLVSRPDNMDHTHITITAQNARARRALQPRGFSIQKKKSLLTLLPSCTVQNSYVKKDKLYHLNCQSQF